MSKPSITAIIDTDHSLAANLKAAFLLNEGTGTAKDYVDSSLNLILADGAAWVSDGSGSYNLQLTSSNARASATTPDRLKLNWPITLWLRLIPTASTPSVSAALFGTSHGSGVYPYVSYLFTQDSEVNLRIMINHGSEFYIVPGGFLQQETLSGSVVDLVAIITTTDAVFYKVIDGVRTTVTGPVVTTHIDPAYDVGSMIGFGDIFVSSSNTQMTAVFGYVFDKALSTTEIDSLVTTPYSMFEEPAYGPFAPTNLVASTPTSSNVVLTWDDNSDDEAGFTIQYDIDIAFGSPVEVDIAPTDTETEDIMSLDAETAYHFRVRAYNDDGNSDWSNIVSITTLAAQEEEEDYSSVTEIIPSGTFKMSKRATVGGPRGGYSTDISDGPDDVVFSDIRVNVDRWPMRRRPAR